MMSDDQTYIYSTVLYNLNCNIYMSQKSESIIRNKTELI